jgi:putative hydrolase of the HAD superfamily
VSLILLDFWGVIGVVQAPADIEEMAICLGADVGAFTEAYWAHRSFFDAGGDRTEYWSLVAADLGLTVDAEKVNALRSIDDRSWSGVHADMLSLVAELHDQGHRLALLSNAPADLVDHAQSVVDGLVPELLFSSQLGLAKPDPRIFEVAAQRLGVSAREVVFVDDNAANVQAARTAGMRVVHHISVDQTRRELRELLR